MDLYPAELIDGLSKSIRSSVRQPTVTFVAIDGAGCAGKTALADQIQLALGDSAVTIGIDDFFLPMAQQLPWRADEDLSEGVPHLRWRELRERVLDPLSRGRPGHYRPYLWESMRDGDAIGSEIVVPSKSIVIVEGLYSLHVSLRGIYVFAIWVDAPEPTRLGRVRNRDGDLPPLWVERYVPRESTYLRTQRPFDAAHVFVLGAELTWAASDLCFARRVASNKAAERTHG